MNQTVSFSQQTRMELFNSFLQKSLYQIKSGNRQEIPAALLTSLQAEKRVLNGIFFFFLSGDWLHFTDRLHFSLDHFSILSSQFL